MQLVSTYAYEWIGEVRLTPNLPGYGYTWIIEGHIALHQVFPPAVIHEGLHVYECSVLLEKEIFLEEETVRYLTGAILYHILWSSSFRYDLEYSWYVDWYFSKYGVGSPWAP